MSGEETLSLVNMKGGAAVEAFDHEFQKVLDNIMDPNTEAKEARGVTMTVRVKPTADRGIGEIQISCKPNLAGPKPFTTTIYMGMKGSKAMAVEHNPNQAELFKQEEPTPLRKFEGGKE